MCNIFTKSYKVILHQFWVKNFFPWKFNLEYGGTFTKLFMHVSSQNMFPTTKNLQIRVPSSPLLWRLIYIRLFCSDDCRSWPREEMINNHGCWGKHAHIPDNDYWGICLFHVVWTNFFFAIILMWYTRNIFLFFLISWTLRLRDNFPERVQILHGSRAYPLHYCTGQHNYLLSNILRFALKICFWADF
jgi:hypothetical protein